MKKVEGVIRRGRVAERECELPRRGALGQAFRERLAESSRGRASRSRHKSDVNTKKAIADYLPITRRGQSQNSEREQNNPTRTNFVRRYCPRPPSNSDSVFDGSTRTERGATLSAAVLLIRTWLLRSTVAKR